MKEVGNVANRKCIRRLGFRSMRAARTRNIVAVLAIALTTILFTTLFTIASSINYSFQQEIVFFYVQLQIIPHIPLWFCLTENIF